MPKNKHRKADIAGTELMIKLVIKDIENMMKTLHKLLEHLQKVMNHK